VEREVHMSVSLAQYKRGRKKGGRGNEEVGWGPLRSKSTSYVTGGGGIDTGVSGELGN